MTNSISPQSSDHLMIALYYWYINIPTPSLKNQVSFHESLCKDLSLFGRIRISTEGLNGVLSGALTNLKLYEEKIRDEIENKFQKKEKHMSSTSSWLEDEQLNLEYGQTLDVKYCHLRKDIPAEKQLFDSISVKVTKEVVSLNDSPDANETKKDLEKNNSSKENQSKKKKNRSRKKKNKGDRYEQIMEEDRRRKEEEKRKLQEQQQQQQQQEEIHQDNGLKDNKLEKEAMSRIHEYQPCKHLTPQEWNEHLLSKELEEETNQDSNVQKNNAILIDARNIYESKIGYFTSKNVPTLLTNTRKYSTITSVFNESIEHLAGKDIYMYCTGGVRCERASVYLQALANSEAWPEELDRPKSIYQLEGGIQKYLEQYGHLEKTTKIEESDIKECMNNKKEFGVTSESTTKITAAAAAAQTTTTDKKKKEQNQIQSKCLFKGKNFVFDPRRYDPVVGNDTKPVGKCIVCTKPCDDYDNKYAPCENMEARCCRCRVLVLLCNECRPNVRVWGQKNNDQKVRSSTDDSKQSSRPDVPEVFCGSSGKACIDEGNCVHHYEIINS